MKNNCVCKPNFRRCPLHAQEYAEKQMAERGWIRTGVTYSDDRIFQLLKSHNIDAMDWYGKWAPEYAVWICRSDVGWDTQKTFLQAASESLSLRHTINSTGRMGGQLAVAQLIQDIGLFKSVKDLKAMRVGY